MSRRDDIELSYGLEHQLSVSIDRMRGNIEQSRALRMEIIKLRRARKQIDQVPDEVREWFEETAQYLDDDEIEE